MVEALWGRGRERLAVCPGREQTLGPLSWGSGGAAGQMESGRGLGPERGRGGLPGPAISLFLPAPSQLLGLPETQGRAAPTPTQIKNLQRQS